MDSVEMLKLVQIKCENWFTSTNLCNYEMLFEFWDDAAPEFERML